LTAEIAIGLGQSCAKSLKSQSKTQFCLLTAVDRSESRRWSSLPLVSEVIIWLPAASRCILGMGKQDYKWTDNGTLLLSIL
jgi:hypothetical protein